MKKYKYKVLAAVTAFLVGISVVSEDDLILTQEMSLHVLSAESEVTMPNIPQLKIGNTTYDVKDTEARNEIDDLKSALYSYASGETRTQSGISANQHYTFDGNYFKGQTITITNSTSGAVTVNIRETNGTAHAITQNLPKDKSISFVVDYDLCDRISGYCAGAGSLTMVVDSLIDSLKLDVDLDVSWSQMNIAGNTGYISTSGDVVEYANQYVSDLVAINQMNDVSYNVAYIHGVSVAIAFYNESGIFISGITAQSGTGGIYTVVTGTITPPENTAFIRYSMAKNSTGGIMKEEQYVKFTEKQTLKTAVEELMERSGENPWVNKKWCAFGTSITDTSSGTYVPFLAQYSGLQVTNRGISGGTIGSDGMHGGSSSILNAILNSNDLDTFDLITLEGFVNDFAAAVSIGEIGDTANTTMYGALHQALSYILANSHAEIVLITETTGKVYTPSGGTQANYNILQKNSLDLYQQDYNDVIIRIGQFYGVHVIDAGGKSQINQYHPEYILDHIHHTTLGGEQYAKTIWEELRKITPAKTSN